MSEFVDWQQSLQKPVIREVQITKPSEPGQCCESITIAVDLSLPNGLQKYLDNGSYDIDNSLSERSIRPFTIGRSASKGFASEEGARVTARYHSLVEICKLNDVSPSDYYTHVLKSVTDVNCDYERLTPMAYASKN